MKKIFITAIIIGYVFISYSKINAQTEPLIKVISLDISFYRTEILRIPDMPHFRSNHSLLSRSKDQRTDYYLLKLSIELQDEMDLPLDIKLIKDKSEEYTYRLEESMLLMQKNKIYDFELEISLEKTGWYGVELGDFSDNEDELIDNPIYYKTNYLIRK